MKTYRRLPPSLPEPLRQLLQRFDWTVRIIHSAERLALAVLAGGGLLFFTCLVDRFIDVDGAYRLPFLWLAFAAFFLAFLWKLAALVRPSDFDRCAHNLDQLREDSRDHLRSCLNFATREDKGGPFAPLSQEAALVHWQGVDPAKLAPRKRAERAVAVAGLLLFLMAGAAVLPSTRADLLLQRFLDPTGNHPRPTATWFEVEAPVTLNGGDDFLLTATLAGSEAQAPRPLARIVTGSDPPILRKLTVQADGTWQLRLREVQRDFACTLVMGPVRSATHAVTVRPRPTIQTVEVTYNYPKYTGLKAKTVPLSGRTLTAIEGTKARITLAASQPLKGIEAATENEQLRFRLSPKIPHEASRFHYMSKNERIEVTLTAENGLASKGELPFNIRTVPDSPPTIAVRGEWGERTFFAHETLRLPYRAQDDLGLAEVAVRAFPGSFMEEAELPKHGARTAEGTIPIPISRLVQPGQREIKLRLQALDLKGQAMLSQPITVRIAVNSYDRQLRTVRNALTGKYNSRVIEKSGFPNLAVHSDLRMKALRTLRSKLLILSESLSDDEAIGPNQAKQVKDIRIALSQLLPRSRYILPSVGDRPDAITTTFDLLTRARLTPRLARLVADLSCAGDLAVPGEKLKAEFDAALAQKTPKAALVQLTQSLAPHLATQEDLAARLLKAHTVLNTELAGYLSSTVADSIARADEERLTDHGFLIATGRTLNELRGLAQARKSTAPFELTVEEAALFTTAAEDTQSESLRALLPTLVRIKTDLAVKAADLAAGEGEVLIPIHRPQSREAAEQWTDVASYHLFMQMDDEGRDELTYACDLARQLALYSATPISLPEEAKLCAARIYARAMRFSLTAHELRVGLLAGHLTREDPETEMLWLQLREDRFALLNLVHTLPQATPLGPVASAFGTSAKDLALWTLPDQNLAQQARALETWAQGSQELARLICAEAAAAINQLTDALVTQWRPLLQKSLKTFREDIAARIHEIETVSNSGEKYAMQHVVFGPLPQMVARNKMAQLFIAQCLNLASAQQLQSGKTGLPTEELIGLSHLLRQVEKDLYGEVGRPISNLGIAGERSDDAIAEGAKKGKVKTYRNLDALVASIEPLTVDGTPRDAMEIQLKERVLLHNVKQDAMVTRAAMAMATPPRASELRNLRGDPELEPLLWEPYTVALRLCQLDVKEDLSHVWKSLGALLPQLGEQPKGLGELPDLLAGRAQDKGGADQGALPALIERVDELSRLSSPPLGKESAVRHRRSVIRQQVDLASDQAKTDTANLTWAVTEMEWSRRKTAASEKRIGIAGLALGAGDDLASLKLPRHLYLELKRAREQSMPELFRERCYQYLNTILEKAR